MSAMACRVRPLFVIGDHHLRAHPGVDSLQRVPDALVAAHRRDGHRITPQDLGDVLVAPRLRPDQLVRVT